MSPQNGPGEMVCAPVGLVSVLVCPLSVVSSDRRGFVAAGVNLMRRENQVNRSYQAVAKV